MGTRTDTAVAAPSDSDLLTLRQIASLWGVSLPALAGRRLRRAGFLPELARVPDLAEGE